MLRRGQRAVMTVQPGLRRIDVTLDDTDSSVGGRDHIADPLPRPLRDSGPEDPRGDRLLPPQIHIRPPRTDRQAVSTSAVAPGTVVM